MASRLFQELVLMRRDQECSASVSGASLNDSRSRSTLLTVVSHYSVRYCILMKKPSLNSDDNFQIFLQGRNKKARYLKYDLSLFSKGTNKIELICDSFDGDTTIHFAVNRKDAKKVHSTHDVDLIFDQKKGFLYRNRNGAGKGFGKRGGVIARLRNLSNIDSSDFLFSNSIDRDLEESYHDSDETMSTDSSSTSYGDYSYGYRGQSYYRLAETERSFDCGLDALWDMKSNPFCTF